jgi:hypothetical protein
MASRRRQMWSLYLVIFAAIGIWPFAVIGILPSFWVGLWVGMLFLIIPLLIAFAIIMRPD